MVAAIYSTYLAVIIDIYKTFESSEQQGKLLKKKNDRKTYEKNVLLSFLLVQNDDVII